jgi:hypothetical protein
VRDLVARPETPAPRSLKPTRFARSSATSHQPPALGRIPGQCCAVVHTYPVSTPTPSPSSTPTPTPLSLAVFVVLVVLSASGPAST